MWLFIASFFRPPPTRRGYGLSIKCTEFDSISQVTTPKAFHSKAQGGSPLRTTLGLRGRNTLQTPTGFHLTTQDVCNPFRVEGFVCDRVPRVRRIRDQPWALGLNAFGVRTLSIRQN
jgi:hypothetical protein